MIEHWCDIVRAVFKAEDAIPEIWNERLREAKTAEPELRDKICDGYVRAIATEIVMQVLRAGFTFEDDAVVGEG